MMGCKTLDSVGRVPGIQLQPTNIMAEKEPKETAPSRLEELVAEKVAAGLPHDTATEVAKRQIAWDAEQAEAAKKK